MTKRMISSIMVALLATSLLSSAAYASDTSSSTSRTVKIFRVDGSGVTMTKGTDKEFAARANIRLFDGYTVTTGADSNCYLLLDDGSLIKMDNRTKIQISKISDNLLSISVLSGGLSVDAKPQRPNRRIRVRVGNSALAIRGTFFAAENLADGMAAYTMFEGWGEVEGYELHAGQVMQVKGGPGGVAPPVPFDFSEHASAFVLETILENPDRFIKNGTITQDDVPRLQDALSTRLQDLNVLLARLDVNEGASFNTASVSSTIVRNSNRSNNNNSNNNNGNNGNGNNGNGNSGNGNDNGDNGGGPTVPSSVNKTWLFEAIRDAQSAELMTFTANAANEMFVGFRWVTQADMAALTNAIARAQMYYDHDSTSLADIIHESLILRAAILTFENKLRHGTGEMNPDVVVLYSALLNSAAAMSDAFKSQDSSDIYEGCFWVTPAEWENFNSAIIYAYDFLRTALGTTTFASFREDIFEVADDLRAVLLEFESAKNQGTRILDKTRLRTTIEYAKFVNDNLIVNTAAGNVTASQKWVIQATKDGLIAAITVAEAAYESELTPEEVSTNIFLLNSQVSDTFEAMRWGTRQPQGFNNHNKAPLDAAIALANEFLTTILISDDGISHSGAWTGGSITVIINSDDFWVYRQVAAELATARTNANSRLPQLYSDEQVSEETQKLILEIAAFCSSIHKGPRE